MAEQCRAGNREDPRRPISQRRPQRVLSLNGGGVRGIVPLTVLSRLQLLCHGTASEGKEPHEIFDVICGTSTGGILAVLLGMSKLSVEDCITLYERRNKEVFEPGIFDGAEGVDLFVRLAGGLFGTRCAATKKVEAVLKRTIAEVTGRDDDPKISEFGPGDGRPYTIVIAKTENFDAPCLFTNYDDAVLAGWCGTDGVTVWEALRATSAAQCSSTPSSLHHGRSDGEALGVVNEAESANELLSLL